MQEFIFDVAIRPKFSSPQRWEALMPALPGLTAEAASDMAAFEQLHDRIIPYLARRLAGGEGVPQQSRTGQYLGNYGLVFWQFLCVRLGPLRAGQAAVEPIFPDIDELLMHLEGYLVEDQPV
ncbi:hypothetical protein [Salinicola halimionae]|uniref:hypothetical protein n=1 Tax=Salinicola halimionae TaxID=1949081 RepID=UPI000DA1E937|nr:hypothetical protein [Salinicola halimionae]